jgi:hypothetical protein
MNFFMPPQIALVPRDVWRLPSVHRFGELLLLHVSSAIVTPDENLSQAPWAGSAYIVGRSQEVFKQFPKKLKEAHAQVQSRDALAVSALSEPPLGSDAMSHCYFQIGLAGGVPAGARPRPR